MGSDGDEGGPSYMVSMSALVEVLQRRAVHQIACERFGPASGRVVQLLLRNSYLEQQAVSDIGILPARETRERLYRLFLYVSVASYMSALPVAFNFPFNTSTTI